ncbi:MAG: hypothetical protein KBF56_03955 [Gemmatimonadaceae bacterium]|jgi:CHASE2 domain-containing sensor protein|nr:hypothetical protein [Gemmatimonadaceae bacterium]
MDFRFPLLVTLALVGGPLVWTLWRRRRTGLLLALGVAVARWLLVGPGVLLDGGLSSALAGTGLVIAVVVVVVAVRSRARRD